MSADEEVRLIEGKLTMADGRVTEFSLSADGTYGQWGADTLILGNRVAVLESIRDALAEDSLFERPKEDQWCAECGRDAYSLGADETMIREADTEICSTCKASIEKGEERD